MCKGPFIVIPAKEVEGLIAELNTSGGNTKEKVKQKLLKYIKEEKDE